MTIMYLYGASGHAKVIIDILLSMDIKVDALIDDSKVIKELLGYPVLQNVEGLNPLIISIGDNKKREEISIRIKNHTFGTAIHSSSVISKFSFIDVGTVVMQGAIVQSGSSIGKHCIINTGATIDHDCKLENFVHISPQTTLCGDVVVGEGTWIGAGAVILPEVRIGKWCVVGAGSVVTKDVADFSLAYGNPCKIVRTFNVLD